MHTEAAPPATLVIFGITGDLAHRLLTPALINMTSAGLLGDDFTVIGVGRSKGDDKSLRKSLDDFRAKAKGEGARDKSTDDAWAALRERMHYLRGDIGKPAFFDELKKHLDDMGATNVVFYLATAPELFGDAVENLFKAGLLKEGKGRGKNAAKGFRRVAVEKPFGHDHASAKALNERLLSLVDESQIYRIDHFLGKETVQNILVTRFANTMIEAVWNNRYIDHVQITAAETVDIGSRGAFYDANGALRDMVPNHLFQLLAMVCMEPPNAFDAESIRNEKSKVFAAIRGPEADAVLQDAVRGMYDGYSKADDVAPDSRTETYVAMKVAVDSWRWAGVPFYLRTGKAMGSRDTHVVVQFKPVPFAQFRGTDVTRLPDNKLMIHIQPNEGVSIGFAAKRPGPTVDTAPVTMDFRYVDEFDVSHATGYETLLYDMLTGDQTLFQRADGVEAAWQAVQATLDGWAADGEPETYEVGSEGPSGAAALIERDGRRWHGLAR